MNHAVELKELRKTFVVKSGKGFKREKKEIVAVDSISLSVEEGQSVAFVGPNGAGKSTTIKMLTGILSPTSGSARVLGYVPWKERSRLARSIGAVFGQRSQLWYHLPPRDSFELLAKIYNIEKSRFQSRRDQLIERFEMGEFLDTQVRKLSLGQRMRAEVAASLLHFPRVLFLDEPMSGLDPIGRRDIREILHRLKKQGKTVFFNSHLLPDVNEVCDRIGIMNQGKLIAEEEIANISRGDSYKDLEDYFLEKIETSAEDNDAEG